MFEKSLGMTRYEDGVHKSLPSTVPPRVGKTRTKEPNRLTDAIHPRSPGAQLPTPRRPTQKRPPLANPVPAPPAEPQSFNPKQPAPAQR